MRRKETEAYLKLMSAPKDGSPVSVVQTYCSDAVVPIASRSQRGQNYYQDFIVFPWLNIVVVIRAATNANLTAKGVRAAS